ncbi:hypothetical protein Ssi02_15410 [Sinosporangium siamense]|uniref:Uncharacterized protein n=2 Tax=Sinosporangium siamense TaxID=1367973 RepID=A0A919REG5_9ACTN|nr:hypothetical protein Ssi02_15410 [Sinosporangium siamense]
MEAHALGTAWMVLGPLSLWFFLRGRALPRIAALCTLAALETTTVLLATPPTAPPPVAATTHPVAPGTAPCPTRRPAPARVHRTGDALTIAWRAVPGQCARAAVKVHRKGRRLGIWLYESPAPHRAGMRVLPVRFHRGGMASLRLTLDRHPVAGPLVPVDGRTGRPIPGA